MFSSQEVEGEMDPGNFSSIPQFMESAGVDRFLTQIPTCWITAKLVRQSLGIFSSSLPSIYQHTQPRSTKLFNQHHYYITRLWANFVFKSEGS